MKPKKNTADDTSAVAVRELIPEVLDGHFLVERWPTSKPIPYARNARKITPAAIDKVAASIKEFGFRQPIVVDPEGVIIAGHTRLLAAQKLELPWVPVHVAKNLSTAQIKAYRLADNRTGREAKDDFELLALELSELKDELGFDLSLTGFDDFEIQPLLAASWNPTEIDDSKANSGEPKSKQKGEFVVEFTKGQFEVITQAMFRLRELEPEQDISDGEAISIIAAQFIENNASLNGIMLDAA